MAADEADDLTIALRASPAADDPEARRRRVMRRPSTPVETPPPSSSQLPDDVVAEQVTRLKVFSLVSGGLWSVGLLMDSVLLPLLLGVRVPPVGLLIEALGITGAAATYLWVRYSRSAAHVKPDAGLWLMLMNAADITLLETWAVDPTIHTIGHLSWVCVVILLSAMIVPSTPRKMLLSGLAAATMGPIGVWFGYLRGVDVPSPLVTLLIYMPAYSCAVAAVVPARTFHRMSRKLREARDLGSYELQERLGEGGMGEVWRARHRLLARPAAIKLVRPQMLGSDDTTTRLSLKRFESEAQATAALTSPHTIRIFDYGVTDDGRFYYVMELLEGRDMASLVAEQGPLPVGRVLYLLKQICHSLTEAHARGLVHRDIKPANIFVCRMGLDYDVAKVLDFGLVRQTDRSHDHDLTASLASLEGVVGTPAFMAPESLTGDQPVDRRADIYALGCVAFFLLTGEEVFHGRKPLQALMDHVTTPPPRPSSRTSGSVPGWVDDLVLACLSKDPADRPQTAAEIQSRIAMLEGTPTWTPAMAREWWECARFPVAADAASGT